MKLIALLMLMSVAAQAEQVNNPPPNGNTQTPQTTYQTYGNITYGSDGTVSQTYGETTYVNGPNGQHLICQTYGNVTYCK
jgi:hypothetical protein